MKKILFFNLVLILIIFIFAELICLLYECQIIYKEGLNVGDSKAYIARNLKHFVLSEYFERGFNFHTRTPSIIKNSKKPSILILGCSFAYGWLLDEKDCIHNILSQKTGRSVYNIGVGSASPREMLYMLENRTDIPHPPVEYIIYIFIDDHIRRLYYDLNINVPHYKTENKTQKLVQQKDRLYKHTFLYKDFELYKYKTANKEAKNKLFSTYIKQIKKQTEQLYPKSKFVIILYHENNEVNWKDIENEGVKLIHINQDQKYDNSEYKTTDNIHPNGKAWREIVPIVIKELKL